MTHSTIYLFVIYGNICSLLNILFVGMCVGFIMFIIGFFPASFEEKAIEYMAWWKDRIKLICCICIPVLVCSILLPTPKELAAIIVIPKVVNNERVQNIGEKGVDALEAKAMEWLDDITPKGDTE